jgi:transposase-like protein
MRPTRGLYTADQRAAHLRARRESGLSIVDYAERHGIGRSTLALWIRWSKDRRAEWTLRLCISPNCCNYFMPTTKRDKFCSGKCRARTKQAQWKARRNGETHAIESNGSALRALDEASPGLEE